MRYTKQMTLFEECTPASKKKKSLLVCHDLLLNLNRLAEDNITETKQKKKSESHKHAAKYDIFPH